MTAKKAPKPIIDRLEDLFDKDNLLDYQAPKESLPAFVGLDATNDMECCINFLYRYRKNPATFNAYRREVERLLQWSWHIHGGSILDHDDDDLDRYMTFVIEPPLAWIGDKTVARFKSKSGLRVSNPEWRPFVKTVSKVVTKTAEDAGADEKPVADLSAYKPSKASISATLRVVSSLYEHLYRKKLVDRNYVKSMAQLEEYTGHSSEERPILRISLVQWKYVLQTAEAMVDEEIIELKKTGKVDQWPVHERTLFIVSALYMMYLRISELTAIKYRFEPKMSSFREDDKGRWWFDVVGKRNKPRSIVVPEDMLTALTRYRLSRGLTELPVLGEEDHHLIVRVRKNSTDGKNSKSVNDLGPVTSTRQIRTIVEECFDETRKRMKDDGREPAEIESLKAATVHWLRHTGISDDVKKRPREHVRDDAGHSSFAITDRYVNSDLEERHKTGADKPIRPALSKTE